MGILKSVFFVNFKQSVDFYGCYVLLYIFISLCVVRSNRAGLIFVGIFYDEERFNDTSYGHESLVV